MTLHPQRKKRKGNKERDTHSKWGKEENRN
jgi:hypothetical protein